jgi:iron donor protein CyaY
MRSRFVRNTCGLWLTNRPSSRTVMTLSLLLPTSTTVSSLKAMTSQACMTTSLAPPSPSVEDVVDGFPEKSFHKIAEATLEELSDALLAGLDADLEDVDIHLVQGVLTVNLGPQFQDKTWVINKQTPNRQIWWSSPLSGPRRYEFAADQQTPLAALQRSGVPLATNWRFSKNEQADLWSDLQSEVLQVTHVTILHPSQ